MMTFDPTWNEKRIGILEVRTRGLEEKHAAAEDVVLKLYVRITALEQTRDADTLSKYPLTASTVLKSQAAQQQATEHLYAPLRSDTKAIVDLAAFVRRLLQFDDLGMECSAGVRDAARQALGMPRTETTSSRP